MKVVEEHEVKEEVKMDDSRDVPATARARGPAPNPVTVGVRQDLRVFFYPQYADAVVQQAAEQRRDLFILAFQQWQSLPKEDPNSYIQIAAVHGRPMSVGYGQCCAAADAVASLGALLCIDRCPSHLPPLAVAVPCRDRCATDRGR